MHNYHDHTSHIPPGYLTALDSSGNELGPGWGWGSMLLADLEQLSLQGRSNLDLILAMRPTPSHVSPCCRYTFARPIR